MEKVKEWMRDWSRYVRTDTITLGLTVGFMVSMVMVVFTGARAVVGSFSTSLKSPTSSPPPKVLPMPIIIEKEKGGKKSEEKKEEPKLKPVF